MQVAALELRDKVPQGVHTLFVGINPAIRSAEVGHYYAHPTNKFWSLIRDSGIAPHADGPAFDDRLVKAGFGFTDVAKRPTVSASQVLPKEFALAPSRIAAIIETHQPRTIAFVSKRAARAYLDAPDSQPIQYGRQKRRDGKTAVWFLPSTSGQSYADGTYADKLREFRRFARHVDSYFTWP